MPRDAPSLVNPCVAEGVLRDVIGREFGLVPATVVRTAADVIYAPLMHAVQGDVVLVQIGSEALIAEIWHNVEILGVYVSCVSVWRPIDGNTFEIKSKPTFVESTDIKATCAYLKLDESTALVVPPMRVAQ